MNIELPKIFKYKKITALSLITATLLTGFFMFNKKATAIFGHQGSYFSLTGTVATINSVAGNLRVDIKKAAGALEISKDVPKTYLFSGIEACKKEFPPEAPAPDANCIPILIGNTPLALSEILAGDPIRIRGTVYTDSAKNVQISLIKLKLGYEFKEAEGVLRSINFSSPLNPIITIEDSQNQLLSFTALRNIVVGKAQKSSNLTELQRLIDSGAAEDFILTINYFSRGPEESAKIYAASVDARQGF